MPQVPQYQEQYRYANNQSSAMSGRVHAVQMPSARDMAYAAYNAGKDFQTIGKAVTDLSILGMKTYDDYNTTKAEKANGILQERFLQWQTDQQNKKGEAAVNSEQDYQTWMKNQMDDINKNYLGNDIQRGRFEHMSSIKRAQWNQWAAGYGREQLTTFQNGEDEASIAMEGVNIGQNALNPEMTRTSLENIAQLTFRMAQRKGLGPEATQALTLKHQSAAIGTAIENLSRDGNISGAQSIYAQYGHLLTPDQKSKLQANINSSWLNGMQAKLNAGDIEGAKADYELHASGAGIVETRGVRGSIADRNNNPLNLTGKGGFVKYSSPEEGLAGSFRQLVRYWDGKTTGTPLRTARQIVETWAPRDHLDKNGKPLNDLDSPSPSSYFNVLKAHGVNIDAPIADPRTEEGKRQMAHLMSAMAVKESSWQITPQQVYASIFGGQTGNMPTIDPETKAKADGMLQSADAQQLGQTFAQRVESGEITGSQALDEISKIQNPQARSKTHASYMAQMQIVQAKQKEIIEQTNVKAGDFLEGVQKLLDAGKNTEAQSSLYQELQKAERAAQADPNDKAKKTYAKTLEAAHWQMSNLSPKTDPAVWNEIADQIAAGNITSEEQLRRLGDKYNLMSAKDKNALKTAMNGLQKVDEVKLKQLFIDTFKDPNDPSLDKDERAELNRRWQLVRQDVRRLAKETNKGQDEAWLEARVKDYANKKVFEPGLWDSSPENYGGDKKLLPDATPEQMKRAEDVLGQQNALSEQLNAKYQELASSWKDARGSWADQNRVAKLLFLQSQIEAERRGGSSPARPEGVPESATWQRTQYGWGWVYNENGKGKFEPYIYYKPQEAK